MASEDVTFIKHVPCPHCGSKDNGALYSDGHVFCFGCREYWNNQSGAKSKPKPHPHGLLRVDIRALNKRGLNEATCKKFGYGVGICRDQMVQVAPYYSANGQLVAQKVRTSGKQFTIIGNLKEALPLFGQHLWRDHGKHLIITEGEIDCLSMSQVQDLKWPVVSVPNGASGALRSVKAALEWILGYDRVVFMFDMDEPGRTAARECAAILPPGKAAVAELPLKDVNDMLLAGKARQLSDAFWNAPIWRPDGILTGDEAWERVVNVTSIPTTPYPHEGMNEKLVGARKGEVVLLVAGTGVGKTTWFREIAHHFVTVYQRKVGWIALEEDTRRAVLGFCSISLDTPLHLKDPDVGQMEAVYTRDIKDKVIFYDHRGVREPGQLMSKVRYMATGLGCDYVFLDHITLAVAEDDSAPNDNKAADRLMSALSSVALEASVGIMVVAHLRKTGREGKTFEEGGKVTLDDIKGSGSIKQISADIAAMERNQQGEDANDARIRVLKCRHTGQTGSAGFLKYHPETGRLKEAQEFDFS